MALKFVVLCALFAAGHAGGIVDYTQYHKVANPVSIANPSLDAIGSTQQNVVRSFGGTVSHYSKAVDTPYSSVRKEDTRINNNVYTPIFSKSVEYSVPVYSAPAYSASVYSAPAYSAPAYTTYQAPAYSKSLSYSIPSAYSQIAAPTSTPYVQDSSATPIIYAAEETTTSTEATTTESTTAAAETTEETTPALRSAEPETEQTPTGYRYDAPSTSSYKFTSSGVPAIFKYSVPAAQAPAVGNYALPAPSAVKYTVPTQYSTPAQNDYSRYDASGAVQVKYTAPTITYGAPVKPTAYTQYSAPTPTVYTNYAAPQPAVIRYTAPAPTVYTKYEAPTSEPTVIKYASPAPTAYTQYSAPQPALAKYTATIPAVYTKYSAPTPGVYTRYGVPEPALKYERPTSTAASQSTAIEENQDSLQDQNQEGVPALNEATDTYQVPSTYQALPNYQAPVLEHQRQESARSLYDESNSWASTGAVSHVSFNGFGTHYVY